MADYKPFSEYVKEARAKSGVAATGNKATAPHLYSGTAKNADTKGGDFWSTFLDILSRPLYTVTNIPNQILNEQAKAIEAEKTGTQYDVLGGIGNVLTSPVRGFFSTNPEDKISTAQLLEKGADVQGMRDPNYVDVQNNFDAPAAGILGFAGDVALDPLTWLPIAGWAAKGAKAAGLGTKALATGEEGAAAAVAASQRLKRTTEVADRSAETLNDLNDLANKYGGNDIQDIKTLDAVDTTIPVGTTSITSDTEAVVREADAGARQAGLAAEIAKIEDALPEIKDVTPAAATDILPSIEDKLAALPKIAGNRSQLGIIGSILKNIRAGVDVTDKTINARLLTPENWRSNVQRALATKRSREGLSDVEENFLRAIQDPQALKRNYTKIYKEAWDKSGGKTDIFGKPIVSTATSSFADRIEWLKSLRGSTEPMAEYPNIKDKPFGATHVTASEAEEILTEGTLNGETLTKAQIKKISDEIDAGFAEIGGAAKVAGEEISFSQNFKAALKADRGKMDKLFGKGLVASMLKMGDDKLDATARIFEDIAAGQKSLSNITNWGDEAGANSIKQLMELLSVDDADLADIVTYNLGRRRTISEVNTAKRDEYAAALSDGLDIDEMFMLADLPSDAAERVKQWLPAWLMDRVTLSKMEYETRFQIKRSSEEMGKGKAFDMHELGTRDGWDMVRYAMDFAIKEADKMRLAGPRRANYVRRVAMTELAMAEKVLDNSGWTMWAGIHQTGSRFLLSPSQIMAAMWDADPQLLNMLMFNFGTAGPYTYMVDALVKAMTVVPGGKKLTRAQIADILTGNTERKYFGTINKEYKTPPQLGFIDGGPYGNMTKAERKAAGWEKGDSSVKEYSADELIDMFYDNMPKMLENLAQAQKSNLDAYSARFKAEAGDLAKNAIDEMEALAADPVRLGRMLRYIDNLERNIIRDAMDSSALDVSALRAIEVAMNLVPRATASFAKSTAKGENAAKTAFTKATGRKSGPKFEEAGTPKKAADNARGTAKETIVGFDTKKGGAAALIDSGADSQSVINYLNRYSASWRARQERFKQLSAEPAKSLNAADKEFIKVQKKLLSVIKGIDKLEDTRVETPKAAPKQQKDFDAPKVDADMEEAAKPAAKEKFDTASDEADSILDEAIDEDPALAAETPEAVESTRAYSHIQAGIAAALKPDSQVWGEIKDAVLSRVNRYHKMQHVANLWHSVGVQVSQIRSLYTKRIHALVKANPQVEGNESVLTRIFSDLQRNKVTPGYEAAYEELRALTSEVHDIAGDVPLFNDPFFRTNAGIEKINFYLKKAGVSQELLIDINKAKNYAKNNDVDLWTAASGQWRTYNVSDPVQYLAQRHKALMDMVTDMSVAADFERMAMRNGLISTTEKAGYVKGKGLKGYFFDFLPENVYFDARIMEELQVLSDVSDLSRSLDGRLGDIVNTYILPVQNTWKYAITLPRPGHHIRNLIGTLSLIFMAEGPKGFIKASTDALRVMSVRNKYTDVDMFQALRSGGINDIPKGGDILFNSQGMDITNDWAYDTAMKEGLLPTYHVGEDYVDDIVKPTVASRFLDKAALRGGKIEQVAGGVSEYRDHSGRLHHFLMILRKHANDPQFKNIDELVDYASKRVKKFNPDSTMLTAWEAKYMRTLIPFYSWFRGALPAIIQSTVMHPGRFMVFPKASFNMAYAMGVNPDSIYDPFPDDQMFPSFLTEQIQGPVLDINGSYFGMNPGIAAFDVYNQLGTGEPWRGVAGMTSPLFRVPLELLSGGAWGTGARIKDPSDYVDASIPGANYLSNITGTSVTGSVASLLQGKGLDPQYQVSAGNKEAKDQLLSFINWFSGLGFQNYSKPNYIDYAEIEKRNAAAKDQRSGY